MAKRRRSTKTATRTRVVRVGAPRAAAPIVIRQQSAPAKRRRRSGGRRRRSGGLSVGGMFGGVIGNALGGALFGFAVKQGWVAKLPAIPILGRTGTAAIALDYWSKHGGGDLARRGAMAAAVLAGYQLGTEGSITGNVSGFDVTGDDYYDDVDEMEYQEAMG